MTSGVADTRKPQAQRLDRVAEEAGKVAEHARVGAEHLRAREVPRGAAHILALSGHLSSIHAIVDEIASVHAGKAQTAP